MSAVPKKFRRNFKFSENSLEGELVLEGDKIRLLFRYSPGLVGYVKSLKGRYDSKTKTWTIPRDKYSELNKSRFFPAERFPRRFSEEDLLKTAQDYNELYDKALIAYQENPFSVDKKFLDILKLEVIFTLSKDSPQLRARVRFGSKAAGVLTRTKGAHFVRSEGLFSVPAETFPELLIKLRDKKISFAVESECGKRLKETADLRKQILSDPGHAAPSDLEKACLTPYVDFAETEDDTVFVLKHATSRHLAALFPDDENFHVRKKKSQGLSDNELLRLINRIQGLKYPLYFSRAVSSYLTQKGLSYEKELSKGSLALSEEMLPFSKTPCAWAVFETGRAGLIIDNKLAESHRLEGYDFELFSGKRFYTAPESKLYNLYKELNSKVSAKETDAFARMLKELARRSALVKKNLDARSAPDAELRADLFSDSELVSMLYPHQRVAVKWLSESEYSMLGDDMGLGKTLSVLSAFDMFLNAGSVEFALIVCPNSLTRNWLREAKRFIPKRQFFMLPEAKKERNKLLVAIKRGLIPCHGLVLNYEKVRLEDVHQELSQILSDKETLLCCDESQRVKNARSKTFQALYSLAPLSKKRVCLTGTPTPRDITDIWSQVLILDLGERFGKNYTKWLKSVAELGNKYSDYAVKKFKPDAISETVSRVHELLLRRKKEDVISLPEKTFVYRDCKLTGSQAERYREICDQLLLRITTLNGDSFIKQIDNLLEEYLRAVQIASNPRLVDQSWQGDPVKFLEADEIVNEVVREQGGKIVIWTNFLGNVDELCERYKDLGARPFSGKVSTAIRDKTIEEFQKGDQVRVLVAVPAAGGVGITLTAAQTAVYIDKSWNAEHWLQSVDRIHRIGQTGSVTIVSLSASKIDELITKNLNRKASMQSGLLGDKKDAPMTVNYPTREELIEALSVVDEGEPQ